MFKFKILFNKKNIIVCISLFIIISIPFIRSFFTSDLYLPKPKGHVRIDLPKHEYQEFKRNYPYSFEYSKHAIIKNVKSDDKDKYYINIEYPDFNATIYITHKFFNGNKKLLKSLWLEANKIISQHEMKATEIKESIIINDNKVKFVFVEIYGEHIASQCQFYTTDNKKNFLMGVLYFNSIPDQNYLQPMIDFIKKDMKHFIKTFKWKSFKNYI
ncbi:MAG: gliding motility lipoprotein GldD [Bacteroidetes bacterium]|nr:gliding motility lipoprotein GldD [Bacteroidota bacterium]